MIQSKSSSKSPYDIKCISFVIPTLFYGGMLQVCIKSVHNICMHDTPIKYEIIVIDDTGSEDIRNQLKQLARDLDFKAVSNPKNMGYTKSINNGIRHASGDLIVFLNDDVIFEQKEWLKYTLEVFDLHDRIGISGYRLLYPDRRIQHGGMFFTGGLQLLAHKHWGEPENTPEASRVYSTAAVTGALMTVRKTMIEEIGMLDENFVMLCSDTDYCLTACTHGWKVIYNGKSYAIHLENQTRKKAFKLRDPRLAAIEKQDIIRFYYKWKSTLQYMHMKGFI